MGRVYNLTFENMTVPNAAATLLMLRPPTTCSVKILRAWAGQKASTTSAMAAIQLITQSTTLPTTLTAKTPQAVDIGGAASAITGGTSAAVGTSGINSGTTTEVGGARKIIVPDAFNVLNGWLWVPSEEEQIKLPPGTPAEAFAMYFPVAAPTLTTWYGGITFQEC